VAPSFRSSSASGTVGGVASVQASALPAGATVGDTLVAIVSGKDTTQGWNINTLADWTALAQRADQNGANRYRMRAFYKTVAAGEPNPTFTTDVAPTRLNLTLSCLIDAPFLIASNSSYINGAPTGTPQNVPALTMDAVASVLVLGLGFSRGATTLNVSSGYTRDQHVDNGGVGGTQFSVAHIVNASANPAGTCYSCANGGDMEQYHLAFGADPSGASVGLHFDFVRKWLGW
jgi:hypothetical protein